MTTHEHLIPRSYHAEIMGKMGSRFIPHHVAYRHRDRLGLEHSFLASAKRKQEDIAPENNGLIRKAGMLDTGESSPSFTQ